MISLRGSRGRVARPAGRAATDRRPTRDANWRVYQRVASGCRPHRGATSRRSHGNEDGPVPDRQRWWWLVESAPHRRQCDGRGIASFRGRDWGLPRATLHMPPRGRAAVNPTSCGRSWGKAWRIRNVVHVAFSSRTTCPEVDGAIIRSARFQATSKSWCGVASLPAATTGRAVCGSPPPASLALAWTSHRRRARRACALF